MTDGGTRRKGRPPKSDKGPATTSIAMRVRPEIYEEIRQDAEKYGRSIAAQAERRVAHREPDIGDDVGRLINLAIEAIEKRTGKSWREDASTKVECLAAGETILKLLLGDPRQSPSLTEMLAGVPHREQSKPEILEQFRTFVRGSNVAHSVVADAKANRAK